MSSSVQPFSSSSSSSSSSVLHNSDNATVAAAPASKAVPKPGIRKRKRQKEEEEEEEGASVDIAAIRELREEQRVSVRLGCVEGKKSLCTALCGPALARDRGSLVSTGDTSWLVSSAQGSPTLASRCGSQF